MLNIVNLKPTAQPQTFDAAEQLYQAGRLAEADALCRQILAQQPNNAEALHQLGQAAYQMGNHEFALDVIRKAIALRPDRPGYYNDLGNVQVALGQNAEGIESYRTVIRALPESPEAHENLALALLRTGDFAQGLKENEWRLQCPAWVASDPGLPQPTWDGRPIGGKTLLLHAESGYGDTFQLIRYARLVAERGARIILGCRPELKPLLERVAGIAGTLVVGDSIPHFDLQIHMASLPYLFGTRLETIPPGLPAYIAADQAPARVWRKRVDAAGGTLRVGLAWRGQRLPDPKRSIALAAFAPLAGIPGVVFHSLQKGDGAEEAANPPAGMKLVDHSAELTDFAQTAALIENLDLTISIDTAAAHLAGAMGKPVFTLLQKVASFQWLQDRADSPWYPTMRLFRQNRRGDWPDVLRRAGEELALMAARAVQNRSAADDGAD